MAGVECRAEDVEGGGPESMLRFVVTLIVSTLMAAVTAWVLSIALAPDRVGARGGSAAGQHARS